jgi:non-specific serine/threonine protein kinase/serine/threonine-protein kinase
LAAAAAVLVTLLGGLATTLWQAREALAARDRMLAEEARSESVRQSLYLLLAESAEVVGDGSDRRAVLAKAAARLQGRLAREPQSAAVLYALGELFFYLGDYEGAIANLRLVTAAGNRVDPATLATARFDLAQALVRNGAPAEAPTLLAAAQKFWAGDPVKWRGKLIDSRVVEALLLRERDPRAALALIKAALVEQELNFGRNTHQTGVFYNNIGVGRQAIGDLPGARAALQQAQGIWQAIGEADSPDALNTANNLASIAVLGGDLAGAEPLFAEAVRIRRSVYGPSAGTAALLNNLGKVRLKLGRPAEAAALLRESAAMGDRYAGSASQLHVSALAGLSEAEIAGGNVVAGLATARRAVAAAATSPQLVQHLAAIALGRGLAANGNKAAALRVLTPVSAAAAGVAAAQLQAAVAAIASQYQLGPKQPGANPPGA